MRSPDGHVKTKNAIVPLNSNFQPIALPRILEESYDRYPSNIEGLEDMRLFYHANQLRFMASSKNITSTGKIVIAYGSYDSHEGKAYNIQVLESPTPSDCQKNWLYVPNHLLSAIPESHNRPNVIFGWHPIQIGSIIPEEADTHGGKLHIHTVQHTPTIFTHFRGSAPPIEYNGKVYALVHHVKYTSPRQYLHAIVEFTKEMKAERYTPLFCFRKTAIEYCIGFHITNDTVTFAISENDSTPGMVQTPFKRIRWLNV